MLEPSELHGFPVSLFLGVLRFLWWLAWELCFQIVGWLVGWPVCRVLSFGRFPAERFTQVDAADSFVAFLVEVIGLLVVAAAIWYLSGNWPL
jgi:hypothetical protein